MPRHQHVDAVDSHRIVLMYADHTVQEIVDTLHYSADVVRRVLRDCEVPARKCGRRPKRRNK